MALIECPECLEKVSDKAVSCPHCGVPLRTENSMSESMPSDFSGVADQKFPDFPVVMKIGKQLVNWGLDAAMDAYYSYELNTEKRFPEGKVSIYVHTNGISISSSSTSPYKVSTVNIHHDQIVRMEYMTQEDFKEENKSVIGRSILGYFLLGPLGAVVGGVSGIGTKMKKLGNYLFVLTYWDVYTRTLQTLLFSVKQEPASFIVRVHNEQTKKNLPEGDEVVLALLNNQGSLDKEKVMTVLPQVNRMAIVNSISLIRGNTLLDAAKELKEIAEESGKNLSDYNKKGGCLGVLVLFVSTAIATTLPIVL